jgi:hypothetical protein
MADLIPPMLIKLQADVSELKTGLAQAENAIKGVDKSVQTASTGMANFATKIKQIGASIGIAFAGTQVLQFGRDVIAQAAEAEAQQQRLAQLLKVGVGATNEQIKALNAQADALEKVGVVTGGNITQTQSQLATFNLQTDTIKRLTPAILDYVTAEKGANASADEFKQMTNGLAQALNGNFGSLTRVGFVLDDHTKKLISSGTEAERSAAIVDVLESTYKGFNEELRNTPEGQMQALRNDFDALKTDLGKQLLPAFQKFVNFLTGTVLPGLRSLGKFIKDNKEVILTLVTVLAAGYAAFKVYKGILIAVKVTQQLYTVATVLMKGAQLASIASTNGLAASTLALNAAMRANPIGLIVTALALVAAGFVYAWNNSETFRKIVITVAKSVIVQVALMIRVFGGLAEMILKVVSGPLRILLKGLALLKVPGAQTALDGINGAIESVGSFAESTSKKVLGLIKTADELGNKKIKLPGFLTGETKNGGGGGGGGDDGGGGGGGGLTDKEKKKLADYKKDVIKIYKDINEVIADAQEKSQEALDRRNEVSLRAHKDYDERIADLKKNFNETNEEIDKRFSEAKSDAENRKNKTETEAYKRHKETLESIEKDYAEKKANLTKKNDEKLADIRKKADEKTADLIKSAANKEINIVQQSMDRLRNAFASKTSFNIENTFGAGRSVKSVLTTLKKNLTAAKDLQENAGTLAGMGYSQTFIEEIVKQGPAIGNNIAKSLKNATPEATAELQKLLSDVANVSENGLDDLAKSMNTGGQLATQELTKAYAQVAIDLKESLAEVNAQMNEAVAESNKAYAEAVAETDKDRNEKIASAYKALTEALADAKTAYDEAIAEATKALTEARESAQKDLDEGLAEATKTLQEALLEAQKDYEKAIDEINKSTMKKLNDLQGKLKEVAADMVALGFKQSAAVIANAPVYEPIITSPISSSIVSDASIASFRLADDELTARYQINQTFNNATVNPADVHLAVISAVKYGNAITVPTGHRTK